MSSSEEEEEYGTDSSTETESSSSSDEEDQFDQFARFRGVGQIKHASHSAPRPIMCLHYFSNALGLQFGNQNEEVYRLDQIEEWAPREAKWLEGPSELGRH